MPGPPLPTLEQVTLHSRPWGPIELPQRLVCTACSQPLNLGHVSFELCVFIQFHTAGVQCATRLHFEGVLLVRFRGV